MEDHAVLTSGISFRRADHSDGAYLRRDTSRAQSRPCMSAIAGDTHRAIEGPGHPVIRSIKIDTLEIARRHGLIAPGIPVIRAFENLSCDTGHRNIIRIILRDSIQACRCGLGPFPGLAVIWR